MKIKYQITILVLSFTSFSTIYANDFDMEMLSKFLGEGGITNLAKVVASQEIPSPQIPSKWYVDNRLSDPAEKEMATEMRGFGLLLAKELDKMAETFQKTEADDALNKLTMALCDISDWLVKTEGYGNILLAERALDIAAVGFARLVFNINYPIEKLAVYDNRINNKKAWMDVEYRGRILDAELGSDLFSKSHTEEDIGKIWASGVLARSKMSFKGSVPEEFKDIHDKMLQHASGDPVFLRHISFFKSEYPPEPLTLTSEWDFQRHEILTSSMRHNRSIGGARDLYRYRVLVGDFPIPPDRTENEMKDFDMQIAKKMRRGDNASSAKEDIDLRRLENYFDKIFSSRTDYNMYEEFYIPSGASRAYDEIQKGKFYDNDTLNIITHRNSSL